MDRNLEAWGFGVLGSWGLGFWVYGLRFRVRVLGMRGLSESVSGSEGLMALRFKVLRGCLLEGYGGYLEGFRV